VQTGLLCSYTINHAEDFNIEFGKQTDLLTRVYINDIIGGL